MSEEERLREYIDRDEIYQLWKNDKLHNPSDFDKFCIEHCKDIEVILEENKKLKQWDCNKDTRNSRQRIANGKLLKENQQLKEQLQQENARLKEKLKDIEKILDADCCVENIYQAICQYLNIHDFELDLEDYLKEN